MVHLSLAAALHGHGDPPLVPLTQKAGRHDCQCMQQTGLEQVSALSGKRYSVRSAYPPVVKHGDGRGKVKHAPKFRFPNLLNRVNAAHLMMVNKAGFKTLEVKNSPVFLPHSVGRAAQISRLACRRRPSFQSPPNGVIPDNHMFLWPPNSAPARLS